MLGWQTMLFLDDDIVGLDANTVRSSARKLGAASAVGFSVRNFPDNSVVCHANRLSGASQDVFVGAPALLVDVSQPLGFFPNVYNEDWLFLYDAIAARRVGRADVARVAQLPYAPFLDPARARAEEFGEVLAEGLMAALHQEGCTEPSTEAAYWDDFLAARARFIDGAAHRLLPLSHQEAGLALLSLSAARERLATITASRCTDYIRRWRADLRIWQASLENVARVDDVEAAAAVLRLSGTVGAPRVGSSKTAVPRDTTEVVSTIRRATIPRGAGIVVPAFLDGMAGAAVAGLAEALPEIGLDGVAFDPRGTWASSGAPVDIAPTTQLADIERLIQATAGPRIVLIGHCYGGLLAVMAAVHPRVTDVVAIMPSRCFIWPEDYDSRRDSWRVSGARPFLRKQEGDLREYWVPYSVVEDAITYDLPGTLQLLTRRILFVAGEHDQLIGIEPVRQLFDECGSLDKELAVLPVQHDYRDVPAQIEIVNRCVLDWLNQGAARMHA